VAYRCLHCPSVFHPHRDSFRIGTVTGTGTISGGERVPFPGSDLGRYGGKLVANVHMRSHAQLVRHKILTCVKRTRVIAVSASATPTAARAADRPTSLSSPLALLVLALPVPYRLAHTSDTTSTSSRGHPSLTKRTLGGKVRVQEVTRFNDNEQISITLRCHSRA
jgi:hypothetical protein